MSRKTPSPTAAQDPGRHTLFEDVQAILTGTLLVALGVVMFKQAGLVTGGVTGLTFLAHYASRINFGLLLVALNLPFYVLSLKQMGLAFTARSLVSVALVAGFTEIAPLLVRFEWLQPVFAAIAGGLLMGIGMLILFRHQASLGGLNVLVLYLQKAHGWRAGKIQMAFDCAIVLGAAFVVSPPQIAISVLGAVALNLAIATNHKPGRYVAA